MKETNDEAAILRLRHEVRGGYKGCCRCSKRFLPYYVGSDGHWYCEDCGQELVKKKKTATFGVWGDPDFKFNFSHKRCVPNLGQEIDVNKDDHSAVDRAIAVLREGMESTGTGTLHFQKMREAVELLTPLVNVDEGGERW